MDKSESRGPTSDLTLDNMALDDFIYFADTCTFEATSSASAISMLLCCRLSRSGGRLVAFG